MENLPQIIYSRIDRNWAHQHLKISTGSYCSFAREHSNLPHIHSIGHEFCFVISGEGEYQHDNTKYQLKAGDIFLSNPDSVHEISSHESRNLLIIFFNVFPNSSGGSSDDAYEENVIKQFITSHKIHVTAQNHLNNYLPFIQQQKGLSSFTDFRADKIIVLMILDMMAAFSIMEIKKNNKDKEVPSHLKKAMKYLSDHIRSPIIVADIAEYSHCSERHLRRLFKEHFGHTIVDEINQMRIHLATKFLLMNYPIARVASEIGIDNHSQFSRLFKSVLGLTPKEYQKKYIIRAENHRSYAKG